MGRRVLSTYAGSVRGRRRSVLLASLTGSLAVVIVLCGVARADSVDEAKLHFERGLSAFALEHFSDAADEYEKAFSLKADPVLLYDAAQAHRLAGHSERALRLYQSYLRLFGKKVGNREKVQHHIDELQRAVEQQKRAQESPPTDVIQPGPPAAQPAPAPPPVLSLKSVPPAPPPASRAPSATVVTAPVERAPLRPVYQRPWFWGVVAGAVAAVGVGVGLGVGLAPPRNPTASLGATTVQ